MKRALIFAAAAALMTSAAFAAPTIGGGSKEMRADSPFAFLAELVDLAVGGKSSTPTSDSRKDSTSKRSSQCEQSRAEAEKKADAKPGLAAGPEPVYLAF